MAPDAHVYQSSPTAEVDDDLRRVSPMSRAAEGPSAFVPQRGVNSLAVVGASPVSADLGANTTHGVGHGLQQQSVLSPRGDDTKSEVELLHRRIEVEVAAKEAVKSELSTCARAVELHVRQIASACGAAQRMPTRGCVDSVVCKVTSFCNEVQDKQRQWSLSQSEFQAEIGDSRAQSVRSYDVLRDSLAKMQRRSVSLNEEMLRVADQNEELMSNMQSVKAANRRLVDQIHAQSEEIARLTQLRLVDEESIERLNQRHRAEAEQWRRDLEQRVQDAEAQHATTFEEKRQPLMRKLAHMHRSLQSVRGQLLDFRDLHVKASEETKDRIADWGTQVLESSKRQLFDHLERKRWKDDNEIVQLEDEVHARRSKLEIEREAHQRESKAWQEREQELERENQDLIKTADNDIERLVADIASTEGARALEAGDAERKAANCTDRLRDLAVQTASLQAMLRVSKGSGAMLDSKCARLGAERRQLEDMWSSTHDSLKNSDASLDTAVASIDELRKLMDAQRIDAHAQCDAEIDTCLKQFGMTLQEVLDLNAKETNGISSKVESLEMTIATRIAEVTRVELELERLSAERATLQRECALWKAQDELAWRLRAEVENQLENARHDWGQQVHSLREKHDVLAARQIAKEEELQSAKESIAECRRVADQQAAQSQGRASALDASFQETDEALGSTKRQLHEKVALLADIKAQANSKRTAFMEVQHDIEKELGQLAQQATEIREALAAEANKEWQRAHKAQRDCEDLYQRGQLMVQETQTGPMAQISALQHMVAEIRDHQRLVLKQGELKTESNSKEIQRLEDELNAVQDALNETEKQLQADTWTMRNIRSEHESALEKLRCQSTVTKEELAAKKEQQRRLVSELEEAHRCTSEEKARLERELAELARSCEHHARDANSRLQAERRRREADLLAEEDRLRAEIDRQRLAIDAADVENRRLRRFISEASTRGIRAVSNSFAGMEPVARVGNAATGQ